MGGRGSYAVRRKVNAILAGGIGNGGPVQPLHLAGMNRDIASGVTIQKTLDFIENEYKRGMTNEQLQIINDDGWVIEAYQGNKDTVNFPPSAVKGRVVTHNHPDLYGGTFSEDDIRSLRNKPRELRASAAEGVYRIRATGRAKANDLYNALQRDMPKIKDQMKKAADKTLKTKIPNIANPKTRAIVYRRDALEPLHRWYQRNASKYGFEYSFTRNKKFKI